MPRLVILLLLWMWPWITEASLLFTTGASQRVANEAAAASSYPYSFGCWFYPITDALQGLIQINSATGGVPEGNNRLSLYKNASEVIASNTRSTSNSLATSSNTFSYSAWHHAWSVGASNINRYVALNGTVSTSNTTDRTITGMNQTTMGADGATVSLGARLSHCAVYQHASVALTNFEVTALAAGACPMRVRTLELTRFAPLYEASSPQPDYASFQAWTLTNSPTTAFGPPVACGVTR